jgi:hypothetical protein
LIISSPATIHRIVQTRQYAKQQAKRPPPRRQLNHTTKPIDIAKPEAAALPQPDPVKSAFEIVSANANHDPINPPRSTVPPTLSLPTRGSESVFVYYFNLGRAYGTFYKNGIKAVWFNYKAARLLRQRLRDGDGGAKDTTAWVKNGLISRSEFQLLKRSEHDIGKLPFFSVLVLVFGEWLVLIVPFIPNAVPGTCRVPKQLQQMQEKAEERRRRSFMLGISEPSADQWPDGTISGDSSTSSWPVAFNQQYLTDVVGKLRADQLYHLSCTLGLHKHIWDRLQLPPPSFLLRRAIRGRLEYLAQDDLLLLNSDRAATNQGQSPNPRKTAKPTTSLSPEELRIAVSERGMDVLGYGDDALRERLRWWLARQGRDEGKGRAMLGMLFGRLVMREWVKLNLDANKDS